MYQYPYNILAMKHSEANCRAWRVHGSPGIGVVWKSERA